MGETILQPSMTETMSNIDLMRMLATSLVVALLVTVFVWLLRRPSRRSHIAGWMLAIVGLCGGTALFAFGSASAEQPDGLHVSVTIPEAIPYHPVPAPVPEDKDGQMKVPAGAEKIERIP